MIDIIHPHRCRAAVALCLAAALLGCSSEEKKPEPVVQVQAATAQRKPIQRVITAQALIYPIDQAAITPKISAPVAKFYVQRGAHVKKGQLLATLENRDLLAAKADTQGAYQQAQAAYESTVRASLPEDLQKAELDARAAKSALDAQEQVYKSRQGLFQQGAIPRHDLEQAQVAYIQAQNTYNEAQKHLEALQAVGEQQTKKAAAGQLESAKGKYQAAEAQLAYSEIRSPIAGVVTERPLYAGEMAASGTPLITVMDLSRVVARAHVPQEQAALLKRGDRAEITDAAGLKLPGNVTVVSPALDPNSTTVEVWVEARNPNDELKPGSSAELSIDAGPVPNAIVVPASAIVPTEEGGTAVMVVGADGHAHQKEVKVGVRQGDEAQILEGVNPGDTVITAGAYGLPDNTQVKVVSASDNKNGDDADAPAGKKADKGSGAGKPEE